MDIEYNGVVFDSYTLYKGDESVYETEVVEDDMDKVDEGYTYVCKDHLIEYGLYNEAGVSQEEITNSEKEKWLTCCVKGCYKRDTYEIFFNPKYAKIREGN